MKKFFNSIRWIFVALLIIPTLIVIVGGGAITSLSQTLTNPENPKIWLEQGDVYKNITSVGVEEIINRAKASEDKESLEDITNGLLNEQEAKQLAENIFPDQWIKEQAETVIDSFYLFLNNEEESFSFLLNTEEINENAKNELSTLFVEKAQNLPECSSENQITIDRFNILEADCLPSSINASQIESQIKNEIDSVPFFQEGQISSKDLGIEISQGEDIRKLFKYLKGSPLTLLFAALILTFLILLTTPKLKSKLKTIGYLWGIGGFSLVVISLLLKTTFSSFIFNIIINQLPQEGGVLSLIKPPAEIAYNSILSQMLVLGSSILAFGAIVVLISMLVKEE